MSCVVGGPRPSSCAAENPGWQDDWAYGCRDWGAADCFQALSWGYTQAQFETLLQSERGIAVPPVMSRPVQEEEEHSTSFAADGLGRSTSTFL